MVDYMLQPHLKIDRIGKYVLLPGDPDRIDTMLKYLDSGLELARNRGFRISNASYKGLGISLVSSGIGCPSAAIAVEELANAGAKTIIRVGTCGGLLKTMKSGDLVIPYAAMCFDGTTKEYDSTTEKIDASSEVFDALVKAAEGLKLKYLTGINRTHDAFYEPVGNFIKLSGMELVSSEMECSSVFMVSRLRGIRAGAILVVNTPEPPEYAAANPSIVYRLADKRKVRKGMEDAIKISLEAIRLLESRR